MEGSDDFRLVYMLPAHLLTGGESELAVRAKVLRALLSRENDLRLVLDSRLQSSDKVIEFEKLLGRSRDTANAGLLSGQESSSTNQVTVADKPTAEDPKPEISLPHTWKHQKRCSQLSKRLL